MSIISSVVSKVSGNSNTKEVSQSSLLNQDEYIAPPIQERSKLASWTAKAITALSFMLPLAAVSNADAANNPQREKAIVGFAEESWSKLSPVLGDEKKLQEVTNRDSLWNNLQASFHISDDTMVEGLEPIRAEILKKGGSNPNIPGRIVHGALYTTAVTAGKMNSEIASNQKKINLLTGELNSLQKQATGLTGLKAELPKELKAKISDLETKIAELNKENSAYKTRVEKMVSTVIPYLGKIIVDTKTKDGLKERHLIEPSEINDLRSYPNVEIYRGKDFDKLAGFAIGNIAEQGTLNNVAAEMLNVGNDTGRRNLFFDVFLSTPTSKLPKGLTEKSREWVFGTAQLKAHEKAKSAKAESPKVMPPAAKADTTPPTAQPMPMPPAIPNPGLPPKARVGSLESLKELDEKLISPLLPYPFAKDASEQEFLAKNILLLAKNNDEFALAAAAQWFAIRPYSDDSTTGSPVTAGTSSSNANFIVLQALATQAQKDKLAFEVLKRVCASYPNMFGSAFISGSVFLDDSDDTKAGFEIIKAFSANPNSAKELITAMADKNAKLIWPEPTSDEDKKTVNTLRDKGKNLALVTMTYLDQSKGFTPYLRNMLQNQFATEQDKFRAAIGVALAKDKESIEPLLAMGVDETKDGFLRGLSLQAALYINAPDLVPDVIRKKAASESPFAPTKLRSFFPELQSTARTNKDKNLDLVEMISSKNPFHSRISSSYNTWLKEQEASVKLAASKGRGPITISDEDKLSVAFQLAKREFGGNEGILASKASNVEFSTKYLTPMVQYFESCKNKNKKLDLDLALPMMDVLAKAHHEQAAPLLAHMATNPEGYTKTDSNNFFGILFAAFDATILKYYATEDLGGTVTLKDANDPNAQILHRVARRESSGLYRNAALTGLGELAGRYEDYQKGLHDLGPDNLRTIAARKAHGEEVIGHMQFHSKGLETRTQMRLANMQNEFDHAKLADRFGATKELLLLANEAAKKDPKAPIIRSVMHALISNGTKTSDLQKQGLDAQTMAQLERLYKSFDRQEYWLGDSSKHAYTGKGADVGVLDVGYAYPVSFYPDLQKRLIYPEGLIRWSDLTDSISLHPTAVASTIHKPAPDANIRTYSVAASVPEAPFRSMDTQGADIAALEDMAQLQLEGKANIDAINYSWGYMNIILNSEKFRTEVVDLLSAYMEILSRMDVKHSIAAANSHGVFPAIARYGAIGEVNNLGLRYGNDGKITQPDGVFVAAAHDKYANMLAEFTSKQDPLRVAEAIQLLSFQGVHVIAPWVENGKWELGPVNGTSFAAPNQVAMLAWGIEARKTAGLPSLSPKEWREVFNRSTGKFPDSEPQEGANYFDATRFLQEVLKPQAQPKVVVAPAPAAVKSK